MTDAQRLVLVRAVHTAIYLVMASAVLVVLYAGLTGARGPWLPVAGGLVAIETVIFAASGLKCPLTAIAARYTPPSQTPAPVSDTFLPERFTRHTFTIFAPLIALAAALLAARWLWPALWA